MAVLALADVLLESASRPMAVLKLPLELFKSARNPMAVLKLPRLLFKSALEPTAVFSMPTLFKSASSPRTVLADVKQPSWHTARAAGESPKQPSVSAMRTGRIVLFLD